MFLTPIITALLFEIFMRHGSWLFYQYQSLAPAGSVC